MVIRVNNNWRWATGEMDRQKERQGAPENMIKLIENR